MWEKKVFDQSLLTSAYLLAERGHHGQVRKFTGDPYIVHPVRVAIAVATYSFVTSNMVAAAEMHDLLEDTDVKPEEIEIATNAEVLELVQELTNPSKGSKLPRAERKQIDRDHLRRVSLAAKIIKMLDRIDNLYEMVGASNSFKTMYCKESFLLLDAIAMANKDIADKLYKAIEDLKKTISE